MPEKPIDGIQKIETISNKEIKIATDPIGIFIERYKDIPFEERGINISYLATDML